MKRPVLVLVIASVVACSSPSASVCNGACGDAGATDAGVPEHDGGMSLDSGMPDASMDGGQDAGPPDVDAGADAGDMDAGADAGVVDAGADAGVVDAGTDAGTADAGTDAGAVDAGAKDAGVDAGMQCGLDSRCNIPSPMGADAPLNCAIPCPHGLICNLEHECVTPSYTQVTEVEPNGETRVVAVMDNQTGLIWEYTSFDAPYQYAAQTCQDMTTLDGGWTWPTVDQLFSLVNVQQFIPDGGPTSTPAIDTTAFDGTPFKSEYWTSSHLNTGYYYVDFYDGTIIALPYYPRSIDNSLRCVQTTSP